MNYLFIIFIYSAIVFSAPWNAANSPFKFDQNLITKFDQLPLSASLKESSSPWPGYYWPYNKGGVGYRWNLDESAYSNKLLGKKDLEKLSRDQLSNLSPIEKFDIYRGDYSYELTRSSRKFSNQNAKDWNGICHGVAAASIHYEEPQITTVLNSDGMKIDFYSSDIKALLGLFYAFNQKKEITQVGKRCFFNSRILRRMSACSDTNAGSFHLLLTNMLGLKSKSILIDLDRYKEVWNHPVLSYSSEVIDEKINKVRLKTTIMYPQTIEPNLGPIIGSSLDYMDLKIYEYWVELNDFGEIVGGQWISFSRPDFIWYQSKLVFDGLFTKLKNISNESYVIE